MSEADEFRYIWKVYDLSKANAKSNGTEFTRSLKDAIDIAIRAGCNKQRVKNAAVTGHEIGTQTRNYR